MLQAHLARLHFFIVGIYSMESHYEAYCQDIHEWTNQAVRLPKEFRFDCDEVFVRKQGDEIVISPKQNTWDDFFDQSPAFDEKFMDDREQSEPQNRGFY